MHDLIVDAVRALGPIGVGLLMLLENLFPPLPSEFIMPLAGYLAARGELGFAGAVAGGTAGSLLGATIWYVVGRRVPRETLLSWVDAHGRWLTVCAPDVERAERFFQRHGAASVFMGRLFPVVRTLISLPAGLGRMAVAPFLFYSALGSAIWTLLLAGAGLMLGRRFPEVEKYVGYATWAVLAGALVWYLIRLLRSREAGRARRSRRR